MAESKAKYGPHAYSVAVGCAIIMFLNIGGTAITNVILPYMIEAVGVGRTPIAFAITLGTFVGAALGMVGGKIIGKITPKIALMVGGLCLALHMTLYGMATSLVPIYISAIVGGGVLALGAHASVGALIAGQFGAAMAPILGVVIGLSNFGSTGVILIMGQLIERVGYTKAAIYVSWGIFFIGLAVNLLLVRNPDRAATSQSGGEKEGGGTATEVPGLTIGQSMKTAAFWFFGIAMILGATLYAGIMTYATSFFIANGLDGLTAANYLASLTVFGAIVTMSSGTLIQKLGVRTLMMFVFGGYILGIVFLCMFPANPVPWMALVGLIFIAFVRPVNALPSLVLPEMFGRKDFASLSSWGMSFYYIGAGVSSTLIGAITDLTGGNFILAFIVLAVMAGASFVLFLVAQKLSPMKRAQLEQEGAVQ